MARKSTDFSQSLLRFQDRNRDVSSNVRDSSVEGFQAGHEAGRIDEQTLDSLRTKYTLQNKALAKNNSLMLSRISDMESKISDLINENMQLRKLRTSRDQRAKQQMEEKLEGIEANLYAKFASIFKYLKQLREGEGLSRSSQLDVFEDQCRPMTSTPKRAHSPPLNIEEPEPIPEYGGTAQRTSMYGDNEITLANFSLPEAKKDFRNSTIMEVDENSSIHGKAVEHERSQIFVMPEEKKANSFRVYSDNEPKEGMSWPQAKNNSSKLDNKSKAKRRKRSRFDDDEDFLGENMDVGFERQRVEKQVYTEKERKGKVDEGEETETLDEPAKQNSNAKSGDVPEINGTQDEVVRRSSRHRRQVNYAPPPLKGKMRRDSERLLDAVGDDVLINHVVVKDKLSREFRIKKEETDSQRPSQLEGGDKDPNCHKTTNDKSARKALTNVTNRSNMEDKSSTNAKNSDLSIFDFVDNSSKIKTYRRRSGLAKKQISGQTNPF